MSARMEHTHVMIMLPAQTLMAAILAPVIPDMKGMGLLVQVSRKACMPTVSPWKFCDYGIIKHIKIVG